MKRYAGHYRANIFCHSCANPREARETGMVANSDGTLGVYDTNG